MATVEVVVGAMYGSEGKGHVTAQIVKDCIATDRLPVNIRVAGPNAGHTVVDDAGQAWPLRTVPVGAAIDDRVWCYIAPGSEIDLPVLVSEVEDLRQGGHAVSNLFVSGEATMLTEWHHAEESARRMHDKIGSTGKGIGSCRAERVMRTAERVIDSPATLATLKSLGVTVVDGEQFVEGVLDAQNMAVVIEGTQGFGLGLHAGHYPQCTSSDTRAIDFLAMAGISPWDARVEDLTVWACARVYPIRVAGNSGPLKGETTWEELGLEPEKTTVTRKIRRVGHWDGELVRRAVQANGGPGVVKVALTMADQKVPAIAGIHGALTPARCHWSELDELVRQVEADSGTSVGMVTTSPDACLWA